MMRVLSVMAMVVLAALTVGAAAKKAVVIKNMQYAPAAVQIKTGDTVVWTNSDNRDHTVVAEDGSFKSENISAGKTFEHKFSKAGTYKYGSKYYPRMRGTVVVKD